MLDVELFLQERYPHFFHTAPLLRKPLLGALRRLLCENELQHFEACHPHLEGFDFVEQVLDYFNFSYRLRDREIRCIPTRGRVVIVANHPIGSLDGLALLQLVHEVRPDVKVVANELLTAIKPLKKLLLAVDNMGGKTSRQHIRDIQDFLHKDGAIIIFPAGEVSRMSLRGIRDGQWSSGFLRFAKSTRAPVLPVFIDGRNSSLFYALSVLVRPLSTLWLVREMYKQAKRCIDIRLGESINYCSYSKIKLPSKEKAQLFKRHLYRIARDQGGLIISETAIAHPEQRSPLRKEIRNCQLLGETADNKQIYLYQQVADSCVMREIGRLRELSFRAVDEGSGLHRDIDDYDRHYHHLVLWDDEDREIVGAYRLCDANAGLPLYTSTLFDFNPSMNCYLKQGLELGRSFVQPRYWGKRSLEYLWYGLGAFLCTNPQYRYLFGPVSLSGAYPQPALEMLVYFYQQHFPVLQELSIAKNGFKIPLHRQKELAELFPGTHYQKEFTQLKSALNQIGLTVPTLYKQYSELCDPGGIQFAGFNIDPAFTHCVDGLVIIDTARIKTSKRARYIERETPIVDKARPAEKTPQQPVKPVLQQAILNVG